MAIVNCVYTINDEVSQQDGWGGTMKTVEGLVYEWTWGGNFTSCLLQWNYSWQKVSCDVEFENRTIVQPRTGMLPARLKLEQGVLALPSSLPAWVRTRCAANMRTWKLLKPRMPRISKETGRNTQFRWRWIKLGSLGKRCDEDRCGARGLLLLKHRSNTTPNNSQAHIFPTNFYKIWLQHIY